MLSGTVSAFPTTSGPSKPPPRRVPTLSGRNRLKRQHLKSEKKTNQALMAISKIVAVAAVAGAGIFATEIQAFLSPTHFNKIIISNHATSTSLFMGKRKKPSMKERRKQRAKKQPGFKVDRGLMNDLPEVDTWEKTQPAMVATTPDDGPSEGMVDESEETLAKASFLVESQRKSVDCLTFIRKRVEESLPIQDAAKSIVEQGYFVSDGFLSSDEDVAVGDALLTEMLEEGSDMLLNGKLQRDIVRLGDGEFVGKIVGGEAYADCPRLTEYVVSLTRHLPPILNKEIAALETSNIFKVDCTASSGSLRMYDRKTQLGAETLLVKPESEDGDHQDRPFGVICEDDEGTENDARRLTAMLFLSHKDWDATCGGGVTVENGARLDAIRDRIILLRSDTCSHRQEPWKGDDKVGLDQASCVVVHFVKET